MKLRDVGLLFLLGSLWGASFILIRIAAPALGAVVLVALRTLVGGSALLLYAIAAQRQADVRAHWKQFLILGALNSAIPFVLISEAERTLTAPIAAILNASTPLFGAVIASVWLRDRLTFMRIVGLLLGVAGVAVVVGVDEVIVSNVGWLSAVMVLAASCFYGLGTTYAKVMFKGVPTLTLAIGQLLGAGVLLVLPAAPQLPAIAWTPTVLGASLFLALVCTSVAYLLYFTLLASAGPTNTMTVTFIVPFFSILWGAIFLGEHIETVQFVGLLIILVSLVMVTGFRLSFLLPRPLASAGR
jgi:drug/metabolite transporter (DMT)-like permease